ncbi:carboxylesterase family protein [Streptomyces sp. NPDC004232]|uniref:carboxylesterase family protein n=1 Tax=Streptomyces sp. NPDC004232 TaxID=3154454 RepID=UPI001DC2A877|nr:carboxylesterase family protein [Streptomyces sp. tea 10]
MPVAGVGPLPDRAAWTEVVTRRAPGLDVTIGITEREMVAFHAMNPVPRRVREVPVPGSALAADGVEHAAREFAFARPSRKPAVQLSEGARVWAYRFHAAAPDSVFGAAHRIELRFLFGTDVDWADAPMLAGARPQDIESLGRRVCTVWLGFIRTGTPTTDTPWPQHTAHSSSTYHWQAEAPRSRDTCPMHRRRLRT